MSEAMLLEYALNAVWQVPLLSGAAWLLVKAARLGPLGEHRVWLGVLALCVLLPLRGIEPAPDEPAAEAVVAQSVAHGGEVYPTPATFISSAEAGTPVETGTATALVTQPDAETATPSRLRAERPRVTRMPLGRRSMRWGALLYGGVVSLALLRLARGWLSASKLLRSSTEYAMDEAENAAWQELGDRLRVALPEVRVAQGISSPVVVGLLNPVLLLPEAFRDCSPAEQRAALCHELAHVKRNDCLTHAVCQVAALPLVWHPLLEIVQHRIARTREMVCDALAAREMRSDMAYARALLGLAQGMLRIGVARYAGDGLGLFRSNKLEERVMKLTEVKQTMSVRARAVRWTAGAAVLSSAVMAAGMFHLTPVLAQAAGGAEPADAGRLVSPLPAMPNIAPLPPLNMVSPVVPKAMLATLPRVSALVIPLAPLPRVRELGPLALVAPLPVQQAPAAVPPAPTAAPTPLAPSAPQAPAAPAPPVGDEDQVLLGDLSTVIDNDNGPHVLIQRHGSHVHRWTGVDGKQFELHNDSAAELTPQQRRDAEAEYNREIERSQKDLARLREKFNSPEFKKQMDEISSGAAQKQMAEQMAHFNSPEFKKQMDELSNGAVQKQMAEAQAQLAEQAAHFNSPEFKKQMDSLSRGAVGKQMAKQMEHFNSSEFKKQMDSLSSGEVQKQMAEAQVHLAEQMAKVNSKEWQMQTKKQIDEAMAQVNSPEFKRQIAEAERQAALVNSPEFAKRMADAEARMDQAAKRLEDAAKALEDAQKQMQRSKPQ